MKQAKIKIVNVHLTPVLSFHWKLGKPAKTFTLDITMKIIVECRSLPISLILSASHPIVFIFTSTDQL